MEIEMIRVLLAHALTIAGNRQKHLQLHIEDIIDELRGCFHRWVVSPYCGLKDCETFTTLKGSGKIVLAALCDSPVAEAIFFRF